jgi:hypothetical protein
VRALSASGARRARGAARARFARVATLGSSGRLSLASWLRGLDPLDFDGQPSSRTD